jgi:Do/DeqQ family serine protease
MRLSLRLAVSAALAIVAGFAVPLPEGARSDLVGAQSASAIQTSPTLADPMVNNVAARQRLAPESREEIRLSFAPIVKRVAPAVVNVYATSRAEVRSPFDDDPFFRHFFGEGGPFGAPRQRERSSLGSGVIVDKVGIVVTNDHVVSDANEVKVALADGREYQAEILLRDERADLAVLRLQGGDGEFPILNLADSDDTEVGDLVLAVGDPFGVGQTVTSGIVSAVARTNVGVGESSFFIQTDAAINPGNSGGALVDVDGALVGINTAIYSRTGGSIGIGFAIPSNMVKIVVAQALAGSTSVTRPWIGISCQEVTPEIAASLGIATPHGALVMQVDDGSPAAAAGLRAGDLIVKAGDRDIGDPAAFDYRLAVAGIGNAMPLTVWRDGATLVVNVIPEAMPGLDEIGAVLVRGRSPLAGASVADLSATIADRFGIRAAGHGAVVVDVVPRSPAARLGLKPGDIVRALQGVSVSSASELAEIAGVGDRMWRITVDRGGRVSSLIVGG